MKILSFDTCFNKTYIVLRENDKVLSYKVISSDERNYHSAYLIPELRNILSNFGLKVSDLDALAVNIGPGSFTGIRAGVTIARVLAQQVNIKLIGVESLKVLSGLNSSKNNSLILLDARKGNVYLGLYDSNGNELISPRLTALSDTVSFINPEAVIISDRTIGDYLLNKGVNTIIYEDNDSDLGLYLSNIAYKAMLDTEDDFHWAKVKPLYLQKPSISKPKEIKNV